MSSVEKEWSVLSGDGTARWPAKDFDDAKEVIEILEGGIKEEWKGYSIQVRNITYGDWSTVDE